MRFKTCQVDEWGSQKILKTRRIRLYVAGWIGKGQWQLAVGAQPLGRENGSEKVTIDETDEDH